jgi:alkanesulfonate monooxygenase SsuD/methylene tetrahydromethanopterin reductase-like flavin-dependent oxidoreductase (luciferase family)
LRAKAFELAGEVADGAISWLCPATYLRDVARPAMEAGARAVGRDVPKLVGHVLVCATADAEAARAAVRSGPLGFFARIPNYQNMFADAGFPEAKDGAWSDAMIDSVTIHGDVSTVERKLRGLKEFGIDEVMASVLPTPDPEDAKRALRLLGRVASHQ